ncbi:hypothetical protein L486_02470 [Kwoniella mangroviensis CBS 10435]|uniref:Extracellular membrane protein CFEM domain-containing protein n=1 Tax=Kwoniella mangroviensis CBS 10435 TaxID=1331196 RepID=A0A1B9IW94_9TREE|nr:hypothetical protein L486_02470 [Kwoniella mangroviensis CBS 10435]OCF71322.1 hypothetical protein I204_07949 [Kwoniella mangroviensis CBS 8886]
MSRYLLLLSLAISSVLSQESSSSESLLTIQTSPPTPISSSSAPQSSGSNGISGSTSIVETASAASPNPSSSSSSSTSSFPGNCSGECQDISSALASCGAGDSLNTTCLCTPLVEANYVTCLQCGLSLNPSEDESVVYQGILDSYINQCASAPLSPISLPNVTITLPSSASSSTSSGSTSGTGSISGSGSISTSISSSTSLSDTLTYPSSSISRGPITSTIAASASSTPSSSSTTGSGNSGSSRKVDNGFTSIGLAGVVGVVIAAAAI